MFVFEDHRAVNTASKHPGPGAEGGVKVVSRAEPVTVGPDPLSDANRYFHRGASANPVLAWCWPELARRWQDAGKVLAGCWQDACKVTCDAAARAEMDI
jgi:hypothetical protein